MIEQSCFQFEVEESDIAAVMAGIVTEGDLKQRIWVAIEQAIELL